MTRLRSLHARPTAVRRISSYRTTREQPAKERPAREQSAREPFDTPTGAIPDARLTPSTLRLRLPLPPSINHLYATVNGRRVLSTAGRRFKSLVGQEVLCARATQGDGYRMATSRAPLALDLWFYFISTLRRDIDGGLKITQDAICEALGINDNRIVEVTLRKSRDAAAPRMELTLRAVEG